MKGADLEHHQVEGPVLLADLLKRRCESGVAGDEHFALLRCEIHEAQSVRLVPPGPRPEKCCDGVAVKRTPLTSALCCQSSSVITYGSTPKRSRCAPTPRAVTMSTRRLACAVMLRVHR